MNILWLLIAAVAVACKTVYASESIVWTSAQDDGETRVHLYFFWSQQCPHCLKAIPFIDSLNRDYPWLEVHSAEISRNRQNLNRYVEMAQLLGREASSVPAFLTRITATGMLLADDKIVSYTIRSCTANTTAGSAHLYRPVIP